MISILSTLLSYILIYKYYALFLITAIGAVGIPLPLSMMMIAVGTFSAQGYLNFYVVSAVIISGNIFGDFLDYWIMRKYGHEMLREKYARKYRFFIKLEQYLQSHARTTIFFTRFVGLLSPLTNFLSGYSKIPPRFFLLYDFWGNLVSDSFLIILGFVVGDYWQDLSGPVWLVGWVIALAFIMYVLFQIFYGNGKRHI